MLATLSAYRKSKTKKQMCLRRHQLLLTFKHICFNYYTVL